MPNDTRALLENLLDERILLLDGSMGALIYSKQPTEDDYRGTVFRHHPVALRNCTEAMVLSQPGLIEEIHRAYLEAGADIIETDTFNANRFNLAEFQLQDRLLEINRPAAQISRRAADDYTRRTPHRPRFVGGSIGPTNKTLSIALENDPGRRNVTFDELAAAYYEQVRGLVAGGVDLLIAETAFDTLVMKACLFAIDRFFHDTGTRLPVIVSGTIFENGRTLSAQTPEAFYVSVSHFDALSVGLNCAVGVDQMRPHIEALSGLARTRLCCYPNAGLPDGFGGFTGTREHTAEALGEFARNGWLNLVGGCCGTTPDWIAAIGRHIERVRPGRVPELPRWSYYSGTDVLTVRPETNFVLVGERTNITGSRRFARLIKNGHYEEAVAVARDQVQGGANVLDVNMDEGLIDGEKAMTRFLNLLATEGDVARLPLMIDSSKWSVIEAGLKCAQGKGIVNSISLKEG